MTSCYQGRQLPRLDLWAVKSGYSGNHHAMRDGILKMRLLFTSAELDLVATV